MAKINQIQSALKEQDGGAFQKLADSYLLKKGYFQMNPIGSVAGSNKVRKGTPDTLIPTGDGKYVFCEYTTIAQDQVYGKFSKDIAKCLDENKTGISITKVKEIVLCYTSDLSPEEIEKLSGQCEKANVNLNLFGLGAISYDLFEKYPGIAKEYLGIEVDTGQIVPLDEFITLYETNKLATTLKTKFHFREAENNELHSLLQEKSLVIISGQAGVGKSRIAIECYRQFIKDNSSYNAYCVFNNGLDLYEDIKTYFSDSGDYLIFVDDANRISGFQYIVQQLQTKRSDQNYKVIVTVRDYALDKIRENYKSVCDVAEITIEQFTDDEIRKILQEEFEINNHLYLDRIVDIAKGNPRLAVMAAQVAKDSNTLESIRDVSGLYNEYYSSIKSDLEVLGDSNILTVSGIVAFFRNVDRTNEDLMSNIQEIFGMTSEEFWGAANKLHEMEVFDMFENEVVKVSDQVLSTYLLYLVFFKDKLLDFSILLTDLFPKYKQRLIDAVYPIVNAFDFYEVREVLKAKVDSVWGLMQDRNEDDFIQLIEVFWFLKPTDTLIYIQGKINGLNDEHTNIDDIKFEANSNSSTLPDYISILSMLRHLEEDQVKMSLTLLLQYAEKKPHDTPAILHYLVDRYGFEPDSYSYNYITQHAVVDELLEYADSGCNEYITRLFIALAENYLHTHFSSTKSGRAHTITFTQFDLMDNDSLFNLREKIIKQLIGLYGDERYQKHILKLLLSYTRPSQHITVSSIVENDSKLILPFFSDVLDSSDIFHCIIVQQYFKQLKRLEIQTEESLKAHYLSPEYVLYDFLANRAERMELKLNQDEYREYKNRKITELTLKYSEEDYDKVLHWLYELLQILDEHLHWQINQGISSVLENLLRRDFELFYKVIVRYLSQGEYLEINPWVLMSNMLLKHDVVCVFNIIDSPEYLTKNKWFFSYYQHLPSKEIRLDHLNALRELYANSEYNHFPYDFDYLLKYEELQSGFVADIVGIIICRVKENSVYSHSLDMLFNSNTEINRNINTIFAEKYELLEDAYLAVDGIKNHVDYDGSTLAVILDNDLTFIDRYLENKYSRNTYLSYHDDSRDYSFIWLRSDYDRIMQRISSVIFRYVVEGRSAGYYESFFNKSVKPQTDELVIEKQNQFLSKEIETKYDKGEYIRFLFSVIVKFPFNRKLAFYEVFLSKNKKFEDFRKLPYEPIFSTWSGSAVPMLQNKIQFYEKVIQLCCSVELLKHRQFIEQRINEIRGRIQHEKRKDFTETM